MFAAGHYHLFPPPLRLRRTTTLPHSAPSFHISKLTSSSFHCLCSTTTSNTNTSTSSSSPKNNIDCVGTGSDVECLVVLGDDDDDGAVARIPDETSPSGLAGTVWKSALLVSPLFFWGTAMVAMKGVLPRVGPFFVPAFRLIPAGALLVGFAALTGRKQPSGVLAWVSIILFAAVDAACFQGFLAEGLQKTSAGLGSVIIDSQPLTVAVLASLLFGETIGVVGALGLLLGVIGLLLLEASSVSLDAVSSSLWGNGEWWMFLAPQSMAVGTVMVRWVSKFSDPVMATGWVGFPFWL